MSASIRRSPGRLAPPIRVTATTPPPTPRPRWAYWARTANELDCDGIAVNASIAFASSHIRQNGRWIEAIASRIESVTDPARNMMRAGDILLLELQMTGSTIDNCGNQPPNPSCYTPVDVDPDVHAAILAATNVRGIIVIAAAGNGGTDNADMRAYNKCDWDPELATAHGAVFSATTTSRSGIFGTGEK